MTTEILKLICLGDLTSARIMAGGLRNGDTVYINTQTSPTRSGEHIMKVTITNLNKEKKTFDSLEREPYFGYCTNWNFSDIVM